MHQTRLLKASLTWIPTISAVCGASLLVALLLNTLIDVVWSEIKQIGLIDSIFRNFYIPPIIFGTALCFFAAPCAYLRTQPYPSQPTEQKGGFVSTESNA
jgi:hypothetical protein